LYVFGLMVAALDGLQRPPLDALNSPRGTIGTIVGPALGGVLIASFGVASSFAVDVVSYGASLLALMRARPPLSEAAAPSLARSARAWPTPGPARICWAPTWLTCRRCSSPTPTRCSRSWPMR